MMILYHTSPEKITKIKNSELFGDALFFSSDIYAMGAVKKVYSLEIAEDDIIKTCALWDESGEVYKEISEALDCTEDEADDMLCERITAHSVTDDCEDGWYIQKKQAEFAKKMGYKATQGYDEQGTVYIVPMAGMLSQLKDVTDEAGF